MIREVIIFKNNNESYTSDFKSENEMQIEQLIRALEGYIVRNEVIRNCGPKLLQHINDGEYKKFYKKVIKICKKAIKELE